MKETFCFLDIPSNTLENVVAKVRETKPELADKLSEKNDEKEFFKLLWENYNIAYVHKNQMGEKVITYVDIDDYNDETKINWVLETIIQEFHKLFRDGSTMDASHLPSPVK